MSNEMLPTNEMFATNEMLPTNEKFELSPFQVKAIDALKAGSHALVTAHTGSGKTLPAEFAIEYFHKGGKKVIYTAPIKALSNQKFHEFTKKFPKISFGILTGDIKYNPEADVLIMTTEILRNTLYSMMLKTTRQTPLDFEMDIARELGCVIFDEVHYINDPGRGKIWEETIMLLPRTVQMLMLSATIQRPKRFADWVSGIKGKEVVICSTEVRVVPLTHYLYMARHNSDVKGLALEMCNDPIAIKTQSGRFDEVVFEKFSKIQRTWRKEKIDVKKVFGLNKLVEHLNRENMLPAIAFVFSRNKVEEYAQEIEKSLLPKDSKMSQMVENECKTILSKLTNHLEYSNLPEFQMMMKLLEKGVAIHHSGSAPGLREMVELLFSKGYIKLLFATETFAVGINMPTKTVIFTGVEKFDGHSMRMMHSHEYTQMAGRAGRRGLDTVGNVIHCCNMFAMPSVQDYRQMLSGNSQHFTSKFKLGYNEVLNMMPTDGDINDGIASYVKGSMLYLDIESEQQEIKSEIDIQEIAYTKMTEKYNSVKLTPDSVIVDYLANKEAVKTLSNKKRRRMEQDIKLMEEDNKYLLRDLELYDDVEYSKGELHREREYLQKIQNYIPTQIKKVVSVLVDNGCLDETFKKTLRGECVMKMQEVHPLVMSDLLRKTYNFAEFTSNDLVALLSCFTNLAIKEDLRVSSHAIDRIGVNTDLESGLKLIKPAFDKYEDIEVKEGLDTGLEREYHFDLVKSMLDWCDADTEMKCKQVIQQAQYEKGVFLGEFIKSLLKVVNIVNELKNIALILNDVSFQHKLTYCEEKVMKFVVTNQSLYL
jgi:superfamily II RNA helicase